jgi:hypothetical protein
VGEAQDTQITTVVHRQQAFNRALASNPPDARQYMQDQFVTWNEADSVYVDWPAPPAFGHGPETLTALALNLGTKDWVDKSYEAIRYRGGAIAVVTFRTRGLPTLTVWEPTSGAWKARAMRVNASPEALLLARSNAVGRGE